jgi:predicted DNA-binding transcriptional regulator AlpA
MNAEPSVWMKATEAAKYAGGISLRTLYEAHRKGQLRATPIGSGRNLLFCTSWITEWLESRATGGRDGAR